MGVVTALKTRYNRIFSKSRQYQAVFGSLEGQLVLGDILREGGILTGSYVDQNASGTAYNEGKRRVAMYVANLVNMSEDDVRRITSQAELSDSLSEQDDYKEERY